MNKDLKQIMQDHEDRLMELDARAEALDMFEQWLEGHLVVIPKPRRAFITVYTKPKYNSDDYRRLRDEHFKRLKEEYGPRPETPLEILLKKQLSI